MMRALTCAVMLGALPAWADPDLPMAWSPDHGVCWKAPLNTWSNASPVIFGTQVCIAEEPTWLQCHDLATGQMTWRRGHDLTDTVTGTDRDALLAKRARLTELSDRLQSDRARYSKLQREARRAGDPEVFEELSRLQAQVAEATEALEEGRELLTPPDKSILGYSTPTPAVSGDTLYALFGQGVLAAWSHDGTRRWVRHLGPPVEPMRGFDVGSSASPHLVGDVLVVAYGHLRGIDPASGTDRWKDTRRYRDYGTPAAVFLGDRHLVVTPEGRAHALDTGELVYQDLGDILFVGPTGDSTRLLFFGGETDNQNERRGHIDVRSHTLGEAGLKDAWTVQLPTAHAYYTPPVLHEGRIYSVSNRRRFVVLGADDGSIQHDADLSDFMEGLIYPSPTLHEGRLYVGDDQGNGVVLDTSPPFAPLATFRSGPGRSTPRFHDGRAYVRTDDALWCFEPT